MKKTAFSAIAFTALAAATATADPVSPTGVAETDTAAIQSAVDAAPGGTVTLASGTFALNAAIRITNGTTLVGAGSKPADVVLSLVDGSKTNAIVIVGSSDTVVSNLTVTAGSDPLSGVVMDSGLLVDCVVRDIVTKNNSASGAGVNMTGGTVRRCLITGCDARDSGGAGMSGEGIYMTDGLVENCTITGNGMLGNGNTGWGGAVCIKGKGTLRGCLVAGNRNRQCGTGVTIVGPNKDKGEPRCVVENCTIVGNQRSLVDSAACGVYIGLDHGAAKSYNIVLRNNIVWGNLAADGVSEVNYNLDAMDEASSLVDSNDTRPALAVGGNNVSVDPLFADAANGDYHCGYSYCVDAGYSDEWMNGAVDLDGNARIINGRVDLGCYEREAPVGFACRMNLVPDGAADLSVVHLECQYVGCPEEIASGAKWWFSRQQDGFTVEATGFSNYVQLPAGIWDVRLEVYGGGQTAVSARQGAVEVGLSRVYASENGSGNFPYDTVEKGLPSITEALGKLGSDGTLYVAAGSYVISNGIRLVEGGCSRIVSLEGPERTVIRLADTGNLNADKNYGLYVANSESYVEGLTFVAGRQGPHYSGPEYNSYGFVTMTAEGAVVTNCVFRDLKVSTEQGTIHSGIGLDISAGTVSDCLFARINAYTSGGNSLFGGIIRITGGLADRVRVEECWMTAHSGYDPRGDGDVVGVYGSGILRDSLVVRCSSTHSAPVCVGRVNGGAGGHAVNCTFVANTNEQYQAEHSTVGAFNHTGGLQVNGGFVTNCIVADNWSVFAGSVSNVCCSADAAGIGYTLVNDRTGDAQFATAENHNIAVAADAKIFRKPGRGDYSPASGSPAINAGLLEAWMDTAVDLAGRPRLVSRQPDLGCFESAPISFSIRLR